MGERTIYSCNANIFSPKMPSKKYNPKLCYDKNTKYFPSIQLHTAFLQRVGKCILPFACNYHSNVNIDIAHKRILDVIDSGGLYFWNDGCFIWRNHK
jgi:hypothetical protein